MKLKAKWIGLALAGAALPGCGAILGLDQFSEGAGGASTTTGTGTSGATSSSGASSSTTTGGGACSGVETQSCYDFDMATLKVGACKAGTKTCKDGVFGACEGQVGPTPEDCSKPGDENCDGVACSEAVWSKEYGNLLLGNNKAAIIEDLVVVPSGNILVTGVFTNDINFGSTAATQLTTSVNDVSIFLAELTPDGSHVWSKSFEVQGDGTQLIKLAVSSSGRIFLSAFYKVSIGFDTTVLTATGADKRDFFVASFDKDGKLYWARTFGLDSEAVANDLAVGPDEDAVIVGQYGNGSLVLDKTYPSPVGYNAFVAKLNHTDGTILWSRSYGDDVNGSVGDQAATAVAVDHTGKVLVAGTMNAVIDFGGGSNDYTPSGGRDVFVTQLSSGGDPLWHTYFRGPQDKSADAVAVDSLGSVYVTGWFAGTTQFAALDLTAPKSTTGAMDTDFYLMKMTPQGNHAWLKQFGDAKAQANTQQSGLGLPLALATDATDNVLWVGGFQGSMSVGTTVLTSAGDSDWFIGKLSTDGDPLWSKRFGDSGTIQAATCVGSDPKTNAIVLGGANDATLVIDATPALKAKGSADAVLARLNP